MNPAKITIYGDFWDCQIYRNRLYIWGMDGSLKIIDWNKLVDSFSTQLSDQLALSCAFTNGNYLYQSDFSKIFRDPDFRTLLITKFENISQANYAIEGDDLQNFLIKEQDSPFKELPTDTEFLSNRIYAITDNGLFSTDANKSKKRKLPVSSRLTKHWDSPLLSISANKYAKIALSGGSEGLYEYDASSIWEDNFNDGEPIEPRLSLISKRPSTFANYQFLSIYSSSNFASSYLSLFKWEMPRQDLALSGVKPKRIKDREISSDQIFGYNGEALSWGSHEKIYKAFDGGLDIVRFNNYAKEDEQESLFSEVKRVTFQPWKGRIIGGGVSYFGTIIECENAVVVMQSDGSFFNIPGSATRWRVYPRSINYENHLHVIFENRLEVYSFNQDYFENQDGKDYGFSYKNDRPK
jgi:hypothetical protein